MSGASSSAASPSTPSGARKRPQLGMKIVMPVAEPTPTLDLDDKCRVKINESAPEIEIKAVDLVAVRELGRGAYGHVQMMHHPPSDLVIAVKRIQSSLNDQLQKRMITELNASMKSDTCPQMVRFYGAMFREGDVWLCMEVMDTSLDKFYKKVCSSGSSLPELFVGRVALSVVEGLNFMKEQMNLMHRDVKPSNILLNTKGAVKLCDFGISGHLTNSVAKTTNAGCQPYMAPERVTDGDDKTYDVRADVWSLGITLVEIAMGAHPYAKWKTPFEQLKQVVNEPSPVLPDDGRFSQNMRSFVARCLTKKREERPKYPELLVFPFLETARNDRSFKMAEYIERNLQ